MNKEKRAYKIWTEEENDFLKQNYHTLGSYQCAAQLKRSRDSIINQVRKIKISKTVPCWTKEEDEILKKYYNTIGLKACAEKLKRTTSSVQGRAINLKVVQKMNYWTEEEDKFLKNFYPKMGADFCLEHLNSNRTRVAVIHRCGYLNIQQIRRKINSEKFIKMDTPESVYIAGFILADGNISKKKSRVSICIKSEDMDKIEHLFNVFGEWGRHEIYPKRGKQVRLLYTDDKIIYDFFYKMDYIDKSYIEPTKILNYISKDLHKYFWRGFIDGDGCWYFAKPGKGTFSITGNVKYQWTEFSLFLESLKINKFSIIRIKKDRSNYSRISISQNNNIKILGNHLYDGYQIDKIGLPRKFEKFQKIISHEPVNQNKILLTP